MTKERSLEKHNQRGGRKKGGIQLIDSCKMLMKASRGPANDKQSTMVFRKVPKRKTWIPGTNVHGGEEGGKEERSIGMDNVKRDQFSQESSSVRSEPEALARTNPFLNYFSSSSPNPFK